jgi:chromate transporter
MALKETDPLLPADKRALGAARPPRVTFAEFFASFWRLGLVAFGGSSGHVALFHDRYVASVDGGPHVPEATFIELFALATALPGPIGSKLSASLGATFGGLLGAVLCFFVFSLPGALAMASVGAWFHSNLQAEGSEQFVHSVAQHSVGLISAAFGLVVIASLKIFQRACEDSRLKTVICVSTAVIGVLVPPAIASYVFVGCMVLGGAIVLCHAKLTHDEDHATEPLPEASEWTSGIHPMAGALALCLFGIVSTAAAVYRPTTLLGKLFKKFWAVGWTVFGGGQVVLPFLLNEVVLSGWLPESVFMSGFGLVGCLPGPFYNIGPFVGGAMLGWRGALCAALALFCPALLLIIGILPFWDRVRKVSDVRVFLSGVNAGAAGLIITGVWMLMRRTVVGPLPFAIGISAATASLTFRMYTPYIVLLCGVVGAIFVTVGIGGPYH